MNSTGSSNNGPATAKAPPADPTDLALLRAGQQPGNLDDLASRAGVPRATAHRRLHRLWEAGLANKDGTIYHTSEAGARLLSGSGLAALPPTHLERLWPFLQELPTPVHRAVVVLVLCLAIARRRDLVDDLHAGMILIGRTKQLKSLVIRICCYLLGADPHDCEVRLMGMRGRGLIARLNAQGELTRKCRALSQPLVWLNEGGRMDPNVKRDLMELFWGSKQAKVEDHEVPVKGVPVLETNGVQRTGSLEERLGLDPPVIRRAFVGDLNEVNVTAKMRAASVELLRKFQAQGRIALPSPAKTALPQTCHELLQRAFDECVCPEAVDCTDPAPVLTALHGVRALLPDPQALEEILHHVFILYETTKFVRCDWRSRLAVLLAPARASVASPLPVAKTGAVAAQQFSARPTPGQEIVAPGKTGKPNRFDLEGNLLRLRHEVAQLGFTPEDAGRMRELLAALAPLRKAGSGPEQILAVVRALPELDQVRVIAGQTGLGADDLVYLASVAVMFRSNNWTAPTMEKMLGCFAKLQARGFTPEDALALSGEVHARCQARPELRAAVAGFLEQARAGRTLQRVRDELAEEIRSLHHQRAGLEEKIATWTGELQSLNDRYVQAATELKRRYEEESEILSRLTQADQRLEDQRRAQAEMGRKIEEAERLEESVRAHTFLGLVLSECVLSPSRPQDGKLASALQDLVSAREWGSEERAARALTRIEERGAELLQEFALPEEEVERRKVELLQLRRECAEEEERLRKARHCAQEAEQRNLFCAVLAGVLLPQGELERARSARLLPEIHLLFEILAGKGFHMDRARESREQLEKLFKLGLEGLAASQAQTAASAPGTPGTAPLAEGAARDGAARPSAPSSPPPGQGAKG